jgi:hypothetical protein
VREKRSMVDVSVHDAFNPIEAEVAILLDSIRAERDDKVLLAFCERAAEDDAADAEANQVAVARHDPALTETFDRVRSLLVAVGSI